QRILQECLAMLEEDRQICRAIGEHGLKLLAGTKTNRESIGILTHCNAGSLATVQYGNALSPPDIGAETGVRFHVYYDETRPLLDGSRITAAGAQAGGIPLTVLS